MCVGRPKSVADVRWTRFKNSINAGVSLPAVLDPPKAGGNFGVLFPQL